MALLLRQRVALVVTGLVFLSVAGLSVRAGAPGPDVVRRAGPVEYAPGEVLIRFEPSRPIPFQLTPQELQQVREAVRAEAAAVVSRIGAQVKALASFAPTVRFPRGLHIVTVKLPDGMSVEEGRRLLEALPGVVYAEPNYRVYPLEATPQARGPGGFPNDTFFSSQWALHNTGAYYGTPDADIDAPEAWAREIGDQQVVVAVIDTGLQITHPDLAENVWANPGEIPGNGVDDDLNGYVDDIHGWDFCHEDASVYDSSLYDDHGTHVAGIIGAVTNNSRGVAGVAWNVPIMALKFLGEEGVCNYTSQAIRALQYAADMKRRYGLRMLTNNSWGNYFYNQALKDAIDASDMLFVAAAGNDTNDNDARPHYPSSYDSPNIIAVAATDYYDELAWFSNYGAASVDLAAPGRWIISTYPESTYDWLSGTSMAAPHVAGAAALAMAHFPGETWAQIKQRILDSVDPLPSLTGKVATGGRLNLLNLINQAPVAKAGPDQTVRGRATVYLDGSASEDPDGDPLTYSWVFTSRPVGSNASLSDPSSPNPWFVVDQPGTYVLQLTVSDGVLTSADTVTITATNTPPVANAGPDQITHWGRLVQLDGSGSYDPDGDALTYRWELVSKPADSTAVLSSTTIVNPTFIADRPGQYMARLVVSDGIVESEPDEVTVTATNTPPVARAGSDQTVRPGSLVQLDGSGSYDPDDDPLTFRWELVAKPQGSAAALSDRSGVRPTFVADLWGKYEIQLTVNDGIADSAPDKVTVTANTPPVANAGPDRYAAVQALVTVRGRASYDPDPGDRVTWYEWRLVEKPFGSTARLAHPTAGPDAGDASFVPDRPGTYRLELVVKDTFNVASEPDTVTVRAVEAYAAPNPARDRTVFYYDGTRLLGGEIRVYSVAGQLVARVRLDASGQTEWLLTDLAGQPLASGLYLWVVVDAAGQPVLTRPERLVIQR